MAGPNKALGSSLEADDITEMVAQAVGVEVLSERLIRGAGKRVVREKPRWESI